ncbi:hypothetical protein ACJMK2_001742 [Sinanodonta woodiana]|uniref:SAM domain-containing protein n=1 Tax=Sinanodonta woodiana TaxID=1069815 RepID=A0ABD3XVF8_SINWO
MSDVFEYDESKQMTLKELYKRHDQDFPLLIIITEGYCGDTHQETFETFQVLRIHCSTNQRRVVAKTAKDVSSFNYKFYSIPVDYSVMFNVVKGITSHGRGQTMGEILEKNKLPVLVKLGCEGIRNIKVACSSYPAMSFGNLLITKEYVEHFYLCNCITSDLKMFTTSVLCALSKNITCCVITGFRNRPHFEFQQYLESLNRQLVTNNVKFDKNQGFTEFAELTIAERSLDTGSGGAMSEYAPLVTLRDVLPAFEEKAPPVPQRKMPRRSDQEGNDDLYSKLDPYSQLSSPVDTIKVSANRTPFARVLVNDGKRMNDFNITIPQAVVRPLNHTDYSKRPLPPKPSQGQIQGSHQDGSASETIPSMLPISTRNITRPTFDVREMNMRDVADALIKLKLEKYTSLFISSLVDGMILSKLNEADLQKDFGFSKIEAIRLRTFVETGHIPK